MELSFFLGGVGGGVLMSAVFHFLCMSVEMHFDRQLRTSFTR